MNKLILSLLCVGSMPLLQGAETDKIKDLTPRAIDANSMRACGANLEEVKARNGYTRRIVLKGGEVIKNMEFCNNGKAGIAKTRYRIVIPAGEEVTMWVNKEGTKGVIEGCINQGEPETPVPEQPQQEQPPLPTIPPPGKYSPPNFGLPPWEPFKPPVVEQPPAPEPTPECPQCVSIMSSYPLAELHENSKPVEVWAEIINGTLTDGTWTFNGVVVGHGLRTTLDPKKLYDAVRGKAGTYYLLFLGHDDKGRVVACGELGTQLTLVRHGRHWFWKLPVIHCLYTYTHDIKKWKGMPLVEKVVFCPVEAAVAWYFWPVAGKVLYKPTHPILPPVY